MDCIWSTRESVILARNYLSDNTITIRYMDSTFEIGCSNRSLGYSSSALGYGDMRIRDCGGRGLLLEEGRGLSPPNPNPPPPKSIFSCK